MNISRFKANLEPQEDFYLVADCGCEVYEGEKIYEWDGKRLCPDCFRDLINDLPLEELAILLDCTFSSVERRRQSCECLDY